MPRRRKAHDRKLLTLDGTPVVAIRSFIDSPWSILDMRPGLEGCPLSWDAEYEPALEKARAELGRLKGRLIHVIASTRPGRPGSYLVQA